MEEKIPKIIHYCWFGKSEKKDLIRKCIQSWKKYLPDYRIIEWNEDNFDVKSVSYTQEAYENKKWAFVSDYIRLYALYNYGGIYFDTDVEVTKNLDDFLRYNVFLGFQSDNSILTAVIGAEPKHIFIERLFNEYNNKHFITDGKMVMQTNNDLLTEICVKEFSLIQDNHNQVLNGDVHVFSKEYFSINVSKEKNVTIHYGDASWFSYDRAMIELKSYRSYYFCLLKLMESLINKRNIKKELFSNSIGIYGNGQLGHMLIKLLEMHEIIPICIIDRNSDGNQYRNIPVVHINQISKLKLDYIIITPIAYLNEIIQDLDKFINGIKIISIENIYEE